MKHYSRSSCQVRLSSFAYSLSKPVLVWTWICINQQILSDTFWESFQSAFSFGVLPTVFTAMPNAKQCPSYHVTLYKSKDYNCYQKGTGFCSLPDYLRVDVPMTQQEMVQNMKSYDSTPGLLLDIPEWNGRMPKWKKAFLLSPANYKIERCLLKSSVWSSCRPGSLPTLLWFWFALHSRKTSSLSNLFSS